jgi:tetratricopeptide (TPR) repeat protein
VGQFQEAITSYRKSLALRDSLGDDSASDPKIRTSYLQNLTALMGVERFAGDPEEAKRLRIKATGLADKWASESTADAELLTAAAGVFSDLAATSRRQEDFAAGTVSANRNLELLSHAARLEPASIARARALAGGYLGAGYVQLEAGRYADAIADFSKGNQLLEQPLSANPKDAPLRRARMVLLHKIGEATWDLRRKEKVRTADPLPFLQQAYQIGNDLVMEDPADDGAENDLANLCQPYASILLQSGKAKEALPFFERDIEILARHLKNAPQDTNTASNLAIVRVWTSDCRRDLHDLSGALTETKLADELWDRVLVLRPGTFRFLHQKADNLNTMGNLLALKGDVEGARQCLLSGLKIAENLPKQEAMYSTSVVVNELRESLAKLSQSHPAR